MRANQGKLSFITADGHSVVTKSIASIIKELYENATVYRHTTINEVIERLQSVDVCLLILGIAFPDGNSLEVIPLLKEKYPQLRILIFSGLKEKCYALRSISSGTNGYLSKSSSENEIKNAIKSVMVSGKYLNKEYKEKVLENYFSKKPIDPIEKLSNREFEIVQLLVSGYGNLEISNLLNIKPSTVSTYKKRVFEKLEINSLVDLVQLLV